MNNINQWYERDFTLEQAMDCIDENLRSSVRNFVAIGYYLKAIRDRKLYQEEDCQNFEEFVRKHYDRDKGWASKCIKVNDQLSKDGNSPILNETYRDYKVSQLVELAYLTEEQREMASPGMTVKEIQAIRKPEIEVVISQPDNVEPFMKEPEEKVAISQQEVKNEDNASPSKQPLQVDEYVKLFWKGMYPSEQSIAKRRDLELTKTLQKKYGSVYYGSAGGLVDYDCSPKGIEFDRLHCVNPVKLTWAKLTDRIFALLDAGEIEIEEPEKVGISQPVEAEPQPEALSAYGTVKRVQEEVVSQMVEASANPFNESKEKTIDVGITEVKQPKTYDKSIMKELIAREEQMFADLGETWKIKQPSMYTRHYMMLEAYKMLKEAQEKEDRS